MCGKQIYARDYWCEKKWRNSKPSVLQKDMLEILWRQYLKEASNHSFSAVLDWEAPVDTEFDLVLLTTICSQYS